MPEAPEAVRNSMAKSSKLIAAKRGRILLVGRRRDRLWMFPGGRRRGRETEKGCLRREIREELPKLKLGRLKLWKEINVKNLRSGRKMSDAIFIADKVSGRLAIGDKQEIRRRGIQRARAASGQHRPLVISATSCSPSEANTSAFGTFRKWPI
nr:NUDIX domain-containing protein [Bradyrhizobium sp. AUGA SZCCT0182]